MGAKSELTFPHELRIKNTTGNHDYAVATTLKEQGLVDVIDTTEVAPNVTHCFCYERNGVLTDSYHATVVFPNWEALSAFNDHPIRTEHTKIINPETK